MHWGFWRILANFRTFAFNALRNNVKKMVLHISEREKESLSRPIESNFVRKGSQRKLPTTSIPFAN
jgi:hypothetical protein